MASDEEQLLALYKNAADNIFYFKSRVFWLTASFSAGTAFLWKVISPEQANLVYKDIFFWILLYFLTASLGVIFALFSYRKKIEGHRKRIDRCCGFVQRKAPGFFQLYDIVKTGQKSLGAAFFYGRSAEKAAQVPGRYIQKPKFMAVYNDWADNFIGLVLVLHIVVITVLTAYKFSVVLLPNFQGFEQLMWWYFVTLFVMCVYFKYFFKTSE